MQIRPPHALAMTCIINRNACLKKSLVIKCANSVCPPPIIVLHRKLSQLRTKGHLLWKVDGREIERQSTVLRLSFSLLRKYCYNNSVFFNLQEMVSHPFCFIIAIVYLLHQHWRIANVEFRNDCRVKLVLSRSIACKHHLLS